MSVRTKLGQSRLRRRFRPSSLSLENQWATICSLGHPLPKWCSLRKRTVDGKSMELFRTAASRSKSAGFRMGPCESVWQSFYALLTSTPKLTLKTKLFSMRGLQNQTGFTTLGMSSVKNWGNPSQLKLDGHSFPVFSPQMPSIDRYATKFSIMIQNRGCLSRQITFQKWIWNRHRF